MEQSLFWPKTVFTEKKDQNKILDILVYQNWIRFVCHNLYLYDNNNNLHA